MRARAKDPNASIEKYETKIRLMTYTDLFVSQLTTIGKYTDIICLVLCFFVSVQQILTYFWQIITFLFICFHNINKMICTLLQLKNEYLINI